MEKKPNAGIESLETPTNPNQVKNYDSKLAIGLGIAQILIGVIAMVFTGVFFHDDEYEEVSNGWGWGISSLLFMASGSLAIAGRGQ